MDRITALISIYIPEIILALFLLINIKKIRAGLKEAKMNGKKNYAVTLPGYGLTVGIMGVICIDLVEIMHTLTLETIPPNWYYITWDCMKIIMLYLVLKGVVWKVIIRKDKITVYPMLFKVFTFEFKDIVSVKKQITPSRTNRLEDLVIKTKDGKKVKVENIELNYEKFHDMLEEKVDSSLLKDFDK